MMGGVRESVIDRHIRGAVERGDVRQAIAYHLQCTRKTIPDDVDDEDLRIAAERGVGSRAWWRYYEDRRRGGKFTAARELLRLNDMVRFAEEVRRRVARLPAP